VDLYVVRSNPSAPSVLLVPHGRLDAEGAVKLRGAISFAAAMRPQPSTIVVDLAGVNRVDQIGVGTFVVGRNICQEVGIELTVRNPEPLVERLFGLQRRGGSPGGRSDWLEHDRDSVRNAPVYQ
jgi:anti-anti-sigma factor